MRLIYSFHTCSGIFLCIGPILSCYRTLNLLPGQTIRRGIHRLSAHVWIYIDIDSFWLQHALSLAELAHGDAFLGIASARSYQLTLIIGVVPYGNLTAVGTSLTGDAITLPSAFVKKTKALALDVVDFCKPLLTIVVRELHVVDVGDTRHIFGRGNITKSSQEGDK